MGAGKPTRSAGRSAENPRHVRDPTLAHGSAEVIISHAVERKDQHPRFAAERPHRRSEVLLTSLQEEVCQLANRCAANAGARSEQDKQEYGTA
jgi:hypothetical protein